MVIINMNGFTLSWFLLCNNDWLELYSDRKTQAYNLDHCFGEGSFHYIQREKSDICFGVGEKTGNIIQNNRRFLIDTIDSMGYDAEFSDPLYKHLPFYITRNKHNLFTGLLYDTYSCGYFDFGREIDNYHGDYRYYRNESEVLDYFVIAGENLKTVVRNSSWLTGKPAFLPKMSLGYLGSTMSYTDSDNAQELVAGFLEKCMHFDVLCDAFQLSSGYTSIGDKRHVFHWNRQKFPDITRLSDFYNSYQVSLCANVKPALLLSHPLYEKLKNRGMFIRNNEGEAEVAQFWDDYCSYLDFTNEITYDWWKTKIKETLLNVGITSIWNDNNEYEIWSKQAVCHGFGNEVALSKIRPVQAFLMIKASYEALIEYSPEHRPYLISRSGNQALKRYAQTWTGDNFTDFKTLRYNHKMGINLSIAGIYNFGHDVGGFSGQKPDRELFIRWIQHGIFMPRFAIHSWNDDNSVNEPWMFEDIVDVVSDLIKFRYSLIPYFYDLLYKSHELYQPIIQPVFYNYPEYDFEADEYMVGENLFIVNIFDRGMNGKVTLLPGSDGGWYQYSDGAYHIGGESLYVSCQLEATVPVFVKAGCVIPYVKEKMTFNNKNSTRTSYKIFLSPLKSEFTQEIFDDDGKTFDYQAGMFTKTAFHVKTYEENVVININIDGDMKKEEAIDLAVYDIRNRPVIIDCPIVVNLMKGIQ